MTVIFVIVGVLVVLALYIWFLYNGLVRAKIRVTEAWSDIDLQLQRRADAIPNVVNAVKGYAKHEKQVLENVTKARAALTKSKTPVEKARADNMLTDALKTLFAVAENYPDLKASQNFLQLQDTLVDTENKIAYARRFYNANVMDYNTKIKLFPNVLMAGALGFKEEEFFETEEGKRAVPDVSF